MKPYIKNLFKIIIFVLIFFVPVVSFATSGACSSHGGVDCGRGRQYDGTVYCNDGWTDSIVYYDFMEKCEENFKPICFLEDWDRLYQQSDLQRIDAEIKNLFNEINKVDAEYKIAVGGTNDNPWLSEAGRVGKIAKTTESYQMDIARLQNKISLLQNQYDSTESELENRCKMIGLDRQRKEEQEKLRLYYDDLLKITCPQNSTLNGDKCICNIGYMMLNNKCMTNQEVCQLYNIHMNYNSGKNICECVDEYEFNGSSCIKKICPANSTINGNNCICNEGYIYKNNQCITYTEDCKNSFGNNVYGIKGENNSSCYCKDGYVWNQNQTACVLNTPTCSNFINSYLGIDGLCYCNSGYSWSNTTNSCAQTITETVIVKSETLEIKDTNNIIQEEKSLITKIDKKISKRMSGGILLQVEKNGEGWYVNPDDQKKYYLGRPADAFGIMRKLGLGAKHSFITGNTTFPDRVAGKILLDVEDSGKAYYINPKDKKAHYLGRPSDAFKVMRELGMGISNNDIRKIDVGEAE